MPPILTPTQAGGGGGVSEAEAQALVDAGVAGLVDSAPSSLDTLNELAAALADNADILDTLVTIAGDQTISGAKTFSAVLAATVALRSPYLTHPADTGAYAQLDGDSLAVIQRIAAEAVLIVRGAPSQAAGIQEWQFSDGSTGAYVGSDCSIVVPDEAYDATGWNGDQSVPTKNAMRDLIESILDGVTFTGDVVVPDEAYDATAWNGNLEVPTKNAVRDKFESLSSGGGAWLDGGSLANGSDTISAGLTTTSTSSSLADIDATNLAVDGTFPASGKVRVVAEGNCHANGAQDCFIGLRNASGLISGTKRNLGQIGTNFNSGRWHMEWVLTGTPGAAINARLAWAVSGGTLYMASGPTYGPWTIDLFTA